MLRLRTSDACKRQGYDMYDAVQQAKKAEQRLSAQQDQQAYNAFKVFSG